MSTLTDRTTPAACASHVTIKDTSSLRSKNDKPKANKTSINQVTIPSKNPIDEKHTLYVNISKIPFGISHILNI